MNDDKIPAMKIILVISDTQRKNLVFVTDTLAVWSLPEAINAIKNGKIASVHTVKTGAGSYLRSHPNTTSKDNLDSLALSSYQLFNAINDATFLSVPGLRQYWELYVRSLEELRLTDDAFIWIEGKRRATKEYVISLLHKHGTIIHNAAVHFDIDPYLLGGIMIDEIARMAPFEEMRDAVASFTVNWNVSVGVAQVKLQTAKGLIRNGYYNPNPEDPRLSQEKIGRVPRTYLYHYVVQPEHSIFFSAAKIRSFIDEWAFAVDLRNRPEIIATLYHLSYRKPHDKPVANERGMQIMEEFYPLAKGILLQK
jgi:hypothetical protein